MVLWWWYKICCHFYCIPRFNRRNNVNDKIFIKTWQYIKSTIWALGNIWRHTLTGLCLKTRQKLKRESTRECLVDFSTFLRKGNRNNPWFASSTTILDRYLLTNSALLVSMTVSITYFILFTFYWAFTRGSPKLSLSRDQSVFVFRSKWKNGRLNLKVGSSIGWHLGKSRCPFHFIISSITWWFC